MQPEFIERIQLAQKGLESMSEDFVNLRKMLMSDYVYDMIPGLSPALEEEALLFHRNDAICRVFEHLESILDILKNLS